MAYREPKLQISQEFEAALAAGAAPLYACYVGPNYGLHRFAVEEEQAFMGEYDENSGVTSSSSSGIPASAIFPWPDHIAGGLIDQDNSALWIEDTLMRYYESFNSAMLTADNGNRIVSSVIFKTNEAGDRTASAFGDRDVEVGDKVRLNWYESSDSPQNTFQTAVAGFIPDVVAGSDDPEAISLIGHEATTVGSQEVSDPPTAYTTAYDATAYAGLVDGFPRDTYTIRVVTPGTGGTGGLDNTVLSVVSDNGDPTTGAVEYTLVDTGDAVVSTDIEWDGAKYPVPLGDRGALLNLTSAVGSVAAGNSWRVIITQTFTPIDVDDPSSFAVSGPYTGTINTQYILTCLTGGEFGTDIVVMSYQTNNGADTAGTITLSPSDFVAGCGNQFDKAIGNNDVLLSFFSCEQINAGDVIVFDMAAGGEGEIHTLVLRDPVPTLATVELDLDLFVCRTMEFPTDFYTTSQDDIVVYGNATVLDDLLGTTEPFALFGGDLYMDYRELLTDNCNELRAIESLTQVNDVLGPATQDNPLSLAVELGLTNSADLLVYYIATCDDTTAAYEEALDILTENDEVYSLVPLSLEKEVQDLFYQHVIERSSDLNNQWRITWFGNDTTNVQSVYDELSNGDDILATVEEFSTGLYRKVVAASALFQTNGVEAGDKVRINFATDTEGNTTYDEYTVDRVEAEDEIILLESLDAEITVPVKIEVWRNLSKGEYAEALGAKPALYNSRRVYSVFADNPVEADGTPLGLQFVAAALAGQRSGVPPHAPLSQTDLLGIQLDPQLKCSRLQLNAIAAGGNWIVTKDFDGRVFTRHQISTYQVPEDLNQREQSKTTNLDHISRDFYINTQDLFGQGNVSPEMISLIRQRVNSLIEKISNRPYSAKLGPQMIGAEILTLRVDEVLRDTIVVEINPGLPDPLNNLTIRFKVGVTEIPVLP